MRDNDIILQALKEYLWNERNRRNQPGYTIRPQPTLEQIEYVIWKIQQKEEV